LKFWQCKTKLRVLQKKKFQKTQKEYFLREQIKAIKTELGDEGQKEVEDEFAEMKEKIKKAKMSEEAEKESLKQIARLEKMHPDSSEASILRTYLEWMCDLPWSKSSEEKIDLDLALEILDEDHFDLSKVKERILEFLAVRQLKGPGMKGQSYASLAHQESGKHRLENQSQKLVVENLYASLLVA
jgi:ATP-dependent Lon protease